MGRRSAVRDPLAAQPSPPDRARGGFPRARHRRERRAVFLHERLAAAADALSGSGARGHALADRSGQPGDRSHPRGVGQLRRLAADRRVLRGARRAAHPPDEHHGRRPAGTDQRRRSDRGVLPAARRSPASRAGVPAGRGGGRSAARRPVPFSLAEPLGRRSGSRGRADPTGGRAARGRRRARGRIRVPSGGGRGVDADGAFSGHSQPGAPRPHGGRAAQSGSWQRRRPAGDGGAERPARRGLPGHQPRFRRPGAHPRRTAHLRAAGDLLLSAAGDDLLHPDDRLRQSGQPAPRPRAGPPGRDRGPGGGRGHADPGAAATPAGIRAAGRGQRAGRLRNRLGPGVPAPAGHVGDGSGAAALPPGRGRQRRWFYAAGHRDRGPDVRACAIAPGLAGRAVGRTLGTGTGRGTRPAPAGHRQGIGGRATGARPGAARRRGIADARLPVRCERRSRLRSRRSAGVHGKPSRAPVSRPRRSGRCRRAAGGSDSGASRGDLGRFHEPRSLYLLLPQVALVTARGGSERGPTGAHRHGGCRLAGLFRNPAEPAASGASLRDRRPPGDAGGVARERRLCGGRVAGRGCARAATGGGGRDPAGGGDHGRHQAGRFP